MKLFKVLKTFIFLAIGILLFIFHDFLFARLSLTLGLSIIAFGLSTLAIVFLVKEKRIRNIIKTTINFGGGLYIIFFAKSLGSICIVWGVWSILREIAEMSDLRLNEFKKRPVLTIIDIIESLSMIALAALLIVRKTEFAASIHFYLLAFEFILEGLWVFVKNRK